MEPPTKRQSSVDDFGDKLQRCWFRDVRFRDEEFVTFRIVCDLVPRDAQRWLVYGERALVDTLKPLIRMDDEPMPPLQATDGQSFRHHLSAREDPTLLYERSRIAHSGWVFTLFFPMSWAEIFRNRWEEQPNEALENEPPLPWEKTRRKGAPTVRWRELVGDLAVELGRAPLEEETLERLADGGVAVEETDTHVCLDGKEILRSTFRDGLRKVARARIKSGQH